MDIEFFPHFIRKNFPDVPSATNEQLIELGEEFKKYLEEKFKGEEDKLEPIWDISMQTVIKNDGLITRINGYHPALLVHFQEWCQQVSNQEQQTEEK